MLLLKWVFTSVFLILTVLALRAAFGKRVSARVRYALWAVVLVRLLEVAEDGKVISSKEGYSATWAAMLCLRG